MILLYLIQMNKEKLYNVEIYLPFRKCVPKNEFCYLNLNVLKASVLNEQFFANLVPLRFLQTRVCSDSNMQIHSGTHSRNGIK